MKDRQNTLLQEVVVNLVSDVYYLLLFGFVKCLFPLYSPLSLPPPPPLLLSKEIIDVLSYVQSAIGSFCHYEFE